MIDGHEQDAVYEEADKCHIQDGHLFIYDKEDKFVAVHAAGTWRYFYDPDRRVSQ